MSDEPAPQGFHRKRSVIVALALVFCVLIKNAWLSDDAYITLRTVFNFIHGYGLTWNADERVQTYTHPLWMLLLSGAYVCVRNIYISSLLLSLGVSAIALTLFAFRLAKSPLVAVVGLALLAASKSFVDFSTSGLENPFTHLLIIIFALVFFQCQSSKWYLFWLSLLGSLMLLNRMDTVLLFLPALLYAWYRVSASKLKALRTMLLAFTPFLAWELFSLFYYGFFFPNTAYAKLNTGLSTGQLLKQGGEYLISSACFDPLLFLVLVSAVLFVLVQREWKSLPLLFGMTLYLGYVVNVGGDFMAGRFLTPPFVVAVILVVHAAPSFSKTVWIALLIMVVALGFFVPNSRWYVLNSNAQVIDASGVADEHTYYASATGLLTVQRGVALPDNGFAQLGREARFHHDHVLSLPSIGYAGYEAGPQVHVLDLLALGDPLLARLPIGPGDSDDWRIGHFQRQLPAGYLETLETGTNRIQDPGLAAYYAHLHDVISGPLFDEQRLVDIWSLNIGTYNGLLDHYIHALSSQSLTSHSFSLIHWHALCLGEKQCVETHQTRFLVRFQACTTTFVLRMGHIVEVVSQVGETQQWKPASHIVEYVSQRRGTQQWRSASLAREVAWRELHCARFGLMYRNGNSSL